MRKLANCMLDAATTMFGLGCLIASGYFVYWLVTSPTLHAFIFK